MASQFGQISNNSENNAFGIRSNKHADRTEGERKKVALGDIKNAPIESITEGKSTVKNLGEFDEPYELYVASSKPVDWFESWVEKAALSDAQVDLWVRKNQNGQSMNPDEEIAPPPQIDVTFRGMEQLLTETKSDNELMIAPCIPDDGYDSLIINDVEDEEERVKKPPIFNDSELSDLDQSVFELSFNSDDDA